jgi:hypothetical protein
MTTGPLLHAVTGHAAGLPAKALAAGTETAGTLAFVTGSDVNPGTLVEVSFEVDDILALTFSATQVIASGLGAALSVSVVSSPTGFTLTSTAAPAADTLYVFTYAG